MSLNHCILNEVVFEFTCRKCDPTGDVSLLTCCGGVVLCVVVLRQFGGLFIKHFFISSSRLSRSPLQRSTSKRCFSSSRANLRSSSARRRSSWRTFIFSISSSLEHKSSSFFSLWASSCSPRLCKPLIPVKAKKFRHSVNASLCTAADVVA